MKIKLVILAASAIGLFAAVVSASAMAESTQMCEADEEPCTKPAEHFHLVGTATQLSTFSPTVTCNVLFLGFTKSGLESQQVLKGQITFSQCKAFFCSAKQNVEEEPSEIEQSSPELGWWIINTKVVWSCPSTCIFHIRWHFLGPLNGGGTTGTLTSTDEADEEEGGSCFSGTMLETKLESLSPLYIKS